MLGKVPARAGWRVRVGHVLKTTARAGQQRRLARGVAPFNLEKGGVKGAVESGRSATADQRTDVGGGCASMSGSPPRRGCLVPRRGHPSRRAVRRKGALLAAPTARKRQRCKFLSRKSCRRDAPSPWPPPRGAQPVDPLPVLAQQHTQLATMGRDHFEKESDYGYVASKLEFLPHGYGPGGVTHPVQCPVQPDAVDAPWRVFLARAADWFVAVVDALQVHQEGVRPRRGGRADGRSGYV